MNPNSPSVEGYSGLNQAKQPRPNKALGGDFGESALCIAMTSISIFTLGISQFPSYLEMGFLDTFFGVFEEDFSELSRSSKLKNPKWQLSKVRKLLVRRNSVRKFGQVMQVMKISPVFWGPKKCWLRFAPNFQSIVVGKRSIKTDSWGPPELFVEVEGTEVIFPFWSQVEWKVPSPHLKLKRCKNFHRKSGLNNFSKNAQLWVASHVNLGRQNSFVNGMEPDPTFFGEKATVATADKPVPTFGESLCLSWFFLGPQWSIKNRHVAAVFCIFAWNHPSHFAVNTSHKSTAVVLPRSRPVKSLMKATAFLLTCFSWRYNGGCIFFRLGPKKIHEKYSSYDFVETKPSLFSLEQPKLRSMRR